MPHYYLYRSCCFGILFCVCLVAANLLETKVVQIWKITATAGLVVFPISYIINDCIAEVWGFRKARLIMYCHEFHGGSFGRLRLIRSLGRKGFNFVFTVAPSL